MTRDDGMRIVRNARDTERLMISPLGSGEIDPSMSKVIVRITGDKNTYANGYPGLLTYRDLSVSDPTSTGAWIDGEAVMVEDINTTGLVKDKRYKGYIWGEKDWTDSGSVDQVSLFVMLDKGAIDSPPASPCAGCGWFAGATERDCWTFSVVSAGGNMDSLDLSQTSGMSWVVDGTYPDGGYWETAGNFTICDCTGKVRLWRDLQRLPQLMLMGCSYGLSSSCCIRSTQTMYFNGGNSGMTVLCCAPELNQGPAENVFTIAITWTRCFIPNPNYSTPGWYCVAQTSCSGTRQCCYLTADPGDTVILCSGPHADEATCTALCVPPSTVHVVCGSLDTTISAILFANFGNGTATTLIYDAGHLGGPAWVSGDFNYNGYSIYVTLQYTCTGGVISWAFTVASHTDTCAEGPGAYTVAYSPFVFFSPHLQPTLSCSVPNATLDSVTITE